jgi:hypothetical protein
VGSEMCIRDSNVPAHLNGGIVMQFGQLMRIDVRLPLLQTL